MSGLHDFHIRLKAHDPTWEEHGSKLRLGVTWGHVNNQAFALALGYRFEFLREEPVVIAFDEAIPDLLDVVNEVFLSFAAGFKFLDAILDGHYLF